MIGWEDAPHLQPPNISQEELADLEKGLKPHQRQARRHGRPSIGAGAIYPIDEDDIFIEPFGIPAHFPRAYAVDIGWKRTAALFGARDPDTGVYFLTGEYYESEKQPIIHAHSIRAMMPWNLNGCIDPSAENSSIKDGARLRTEYVRLGLRLKRANNAMEAGLHRVLVLMQGGQLKVFRTLRHFRTELRLYRRIETKEKVKIVKQNDHLMDCMRYLLNTTGVFKTRPQQRAARTPQGDWS